MDKIEVIFNGNKKEVKVNDKFNYLTILDLFKDKNVYYAKCKCDCEKTVDKVCLRNIMSESTKSCGCYNKIATINRNYKHGHKSRGSHNRLYNIWLDMKRRCNNPNRKDAKNYFLKNIRVCEEWNDYNSFYEWSINNGYSDNLTIERINNDKNYSPENCKWIQKSEQSKNRKSNHYITYDNETRTLSDWSRITGLSRGTIYGRLNNGWSIEKTLTTPKKQ